MKKNCLRIKNQNWNYREIGEIEFMFRSKTKIKLHKKTDSTLT